MGKRKRAVGDHLIHSEAASTHPRNGPGITKQAKTTSQTPVTVQIVAGTYERILHGISATIHVQGNSADQGNGAAVEFADTFLFNAHDSAVRCLALSPSTHQETIALASGGSDQTINLYQLSTRASKTRPAHGPSLPSLAGRKIVENSKNRELGSLQHHAASVNALQFPTRSKLLSAADDNTIAVARTRDWTILSTIKIPIPKAHGRPSGDTAPLGGAPSGVNDFAIHPSMKLMVSVSKGERCMRLWNLITGKKAGVLNFEKSLLQAAGEGRWGRGEGLKVEWNSLGEEFVVGFEKGGVVFGLDSKPKGIVKISPPSKIHQVRYVNYGNNDQLRPNVLAVSTEDGRVMFFSTSPASSDLGPQLPICPAIGEIVSDDGDPKGRVKDFEILNTTGAGSTSMPGFLVSASSEGLIFIWSLDLAPSLEASASVHRPAGAAKSTNGGPDGKPRSQGVSELVPQVGRLIGKYETGNRITCLKAFIMTEAACEDERSALDNALQLKGGPEDTSDDASD
ncbi:MAG: hypothetical protein LQ345_000035 [Seirophora villosa]|nr:MAG: hypothetical protein LQ345_000035 [Seirophora villosa]